MDEISKKVLRAIHSSLDRLTRAQNLNAEQLTEVFMATTALGYQIARMEYPAGALEKAKAAEMELSNGASSSDARRRIAADEWDTMFGASLCAAIETGKIDNDTSTLGRIRDILVDYHWPMDPMIDAGTRSTYAGGRGDTRRVDEADSGPELSKSILEDWLKQNGHIGPNAAVTKFNRLMGGYSKATYIVSISNSSTEETVVIRKDSPGLPTGSSVISEFPILRDMVRIGVPAPEPLWIEADADLCGGAFIGVGFSSGTPANQIVPTNAGSQRRWAQSTAKALAQLHSQTSQLGADVRCYLADEINALEDRMLARERAPHPGLLIGLNWLRRNIDWLAGRPACRIHGDVGFHNMLMADDGITALLDWEFSRIGDPVEDLASIKPFMDQIESWDEFYQSYQAAGGFTVDRRAEAYFKVWQETRNMVACLGSLNSLLLPGVNEIPLTVAGTIYIPKYEIAIFDAIALAEDGYE